MRKLIYAINLTIDGCLDHTKFGIPPDDDLFEYNIQLVQDADLLIYGRKCYQIMVPYWPDVLKNPSGESQSDVDFARAFDSADKVVFSRTLDKAEGKNTIIVRTGLQEEIVQLKKEPGEYMVVGGVALASELMALGLVDEFRFVVMPVVTSGGKRLMEGVDLRENLQLKLVESRTFKSGAVLLRYIKQ